MFSWIRSDKIRQVVTVSFICLFVTGCAGWQRGCTNWRASQFGADWIVTQSDMNGHPFMCWKLRNASVVNEDHSDGVHWMDTHSGSMVHIAGLAYNYIQVEQGDFDAAAKLLDIDASKCGSGRYPSAAN